VQALYNVCAAATEELTKAVEAEAWRSVTRTAEDK